MDNPNSVIEKTYSLMACTACGAEAYASCNCRAAYKPIEIAAKAVAANPEKSDRAIADEIGVSHATVSRARATVSGETVDEPRIGLDGRTRKQPVRRRESLEEHAARLRFEREVAAEVTPEEKAGLRAEVRKTINITAVERAWERLKETDASDQIALRKALENLINEAMKALGAFGGLQ